MKAATADLVRYGNSIFVMAYQERHTGAVATREEAEASAAASFASRRSQQKQFESLHCPALAFKSAKAAARRLVTA